MQQPIVEPWNSTGHRRSAQAWRSADTLLARYSAASLEAAYVVSPTHCILWSHKTLTFATSCALGCSSFHNYTRNDTIPSAGHLLKPGRDTNGRYIPICFYLHPLAQERAQFTLQPGRRHKVWQEHVASDSFTTKDGPTNSSSKCLAVPRCVSLALQLEQLPWCALCSP